MGKWMSLNMLKAGYEVFVHDLNPAACTFLTAQGAKLSQNPEDLAGKVDWIFLACRTPGWLRKLYLKKTGSFTVQKKGSVIVDLSTISYERTLWIGQELNEMGVLADAPVSGMEAGAQGRAI